MCLLVAHLIYGLTPQVALGCGRPCFYLFSLAEQLLSTRVPQDAIGTVFSNRSRVCMFLRNSRLEPYTAVQLSRPAAISWGGLVFDLVFRSRTPSINFSEPQRTASGRPSGRLQLLGDRKYFDLLTGLWANPFVAGFRLAYGGPCARTPPQLITPISVMLNTFVVKGSGRSQPSRKVLRHLWRV